LYKTKPVKTKYNQLKKQYTDWWCFTNKLI
jgi:hypothetical protein